MVDSIREIDVRCNSAFDIIREGCGSMVFQTDYLLLYSLRCNNSRSQISIRARIYFCDITHTTQSIDENLHVEVSYIDERRSRFLASKTHCSGII